MKRIKLYEEFTEETLNTNNSTYDRYLNKSVNREEMVAWSNPGSQLRNFEMVSNYINNDDSLLDYGCGVGDFIKHLQTENKNLSDYLGVDINPNFIEIAKETYPNNNFQTIKNINQVRGLYDKVVAIGVFTWYIKKDEFINTINSLYDLCEEEVVLTLLGGSTPYSNEDYDSSSEEDYWSGQYRYYDESLFRTLFPEFNFKFEQRSSTFLVRIIK